MKKIIILALCALTLLCAFTAFAENTMTEAAVVSDQIASGSCGANANWTLYSDGELIISGRGTMDDYKSAAMPWYAYRADITKVTVDEGITYLSAMAFYNHTAITSVSLPDGLLVIGQYAFFGCRGIQSAQIPESVYAIGKYAFRKTKLTQAVFAVTEGWEAEGDTISAQEIRDPNKAAKMLTLSHLEGYGQYTLQWSRSGSDGEDCMASGKCGASLSWRLTATGELIISGSGAMSKMTSKTAPWSEYKKLIIKLTAEEGVTSTGDCAFYGCGNLTSVSLPSTLAEIKRYSFFECKALRSVTVPESVTYIGNHAFRKCNAAKEIVFASPIGWSAGDVSVSSEELASDNAVTLITLTYYKKIWTADKDDELRKNAVAELEGYANAENYRAEQQKELALAIENGKAAIGSAVGSEAISSALANAKSAIDAIETDAFMTAREPVIETDLKNGTVYTLPSLLFNVKVSNAAGEKLSAEDVTVLVNGTKATLVWEDDIMTSYSYEFTEAGEQTVTVIAADGKYTKTVEYKMSYSPEASTTITVAIEAFTTGVGYIVKPYSLTLDTETLTDMAEYFGISDAEAMKEAVNGGYILEYVIYINGYTSVYTGTLDEGYYLSSISDIDGISLSIDSSADWWWEWEERLMNGAYVYLESYDPYTEGTLAEMDYCYSSGWMYCVNGTFLNVGFSDYTPSNGDVVRIQYTLCYGADVGGTSALGGGFFTDIAPNLDRDSLTALIAQAIEEGFVGDALDNAAAVISYPNVDESYQEMIDQAYNELYAEMNR